MPSPFGNARPVNPIDPPSRDAGPRGGGRGYGGGGRGGGGRGGGRDDMGYEARLTAQTRSRFDDGGERTFSTMRREVPVEVRLEGVVEKVNNYGGRVTYGGTETCPPDTAFFELRETPRDVRLADGDLISFVLADERGGKGGKGGKGGGKGGGYGYGRPPLPPNGPPVPPAGAAGGCEDITRAAEQDTNAYDDIPVRSRRALWLMTAGALTWGRRALTMELTRVRSKTRAKTAPHPWTNYSLLITNY